MKSRHTPVGHFGRSMSGRSAETVVQHDLHILHFMSLPAAVVNPARVRQFVRASSLLAKTDKPVAFMLAEFGRKMQSKRYAGKSEAEKQLSALLVRRK